MIQTAIAAMALLTILTGCGRDDPIVAKNIKNGTEVHESQVQKMSASLKGNDRVPCEELLRRIKLSGQIEFPNGEQAWLEACREGYGK